MDGEYTQSTQTVTNANVCFSSKRSEDALILGIYIDSDLLTAKK